MSIAVIGGTGVYDLGADSTPEVVATPYGDVAVYRLMLAGKELIFMPRHGCDHAVPPHRINYRANIWALHAAGVREVLATQAVGSLNGAMRPGDFVLLSQFLDWTKGRVSTFFDGNGLPVVHVDVSHPYCQRLSNALLHAGEFLGSDLHSGGVYACTEGPRFETAAEVQALRRLDADLVGMTNVPEVVLAREAGLCYAAVCIVCNWGAGMTEVPLTQEEVLGIMAERRNSIQRLIAEFLSTRRDGLCRCAELGFPQDLPQRASQ